MCCAVLQRSILGFNSKKKKNTSILKIEYYVIINYSQRLSKFIIILLMT